MVITISSTANAADILSWLRMRKIKTCSYKRRKQFHYRNKNTNLIGE